MIRSIYFRSTPHPVTVTTRIITCLVGNTYKPSFATVTGWGVDPRYNPLYKTIKRAFEHCSIGKGFHTLPGKKSRLEKPNKDMDDGGGLEVDDFSRFGEKG